jgi:hypothetical protein
MEPRFGHDFSQVRVHSGPVAEQSAREVNANAYTVGRNIVFAGGQYAPHTAEGQKLIAHELTHVVQQGTQTSLPASVPLPIDTSGEPAAEQASEKVISGQPTGDMGSGHETSIQRQLWGVGTPRFMPPAPRPMPPMPPPAPVPWVPPPAPVPWVPPQPIPPFFPVPHQEPVPREEPMPGEEPEAEKQRKRNQCGSRHLPYTLVSSESQSEHAELD